MRRFVERWYGDGVSYDVVFDDDPARFDVLAGELVVFTSSDFVDVLRWCMRPEAALEVASPSETTDTTDAIELSPPFDPDAD